MNSGRELRTCKDCGHQWFTQSQTVEPKQCPRPLGCGSRNWKQGTKKRRKSHSVRPTAGERATAVA